MRGGRACRAGPIRGQTRRVLWSLAGVALIWPLAAMSARAQDPGGGMADALAGVAWLTGCWSMSAPGVTIEEYWMPPRGGAMLGMSRTVQDGETTAYELVLIREAEGRLLFEAHPSGQAHAVFESTRLNGETATFENPKHDFPRRIVYSRLSADSISAVIDDAKGGGSIEFRYARTSCSS